MRPLFILLLLLLSSPQSANVTNVTLTDLNPAPDLLLTSKYRLSSSFVSPPNNGIFVSKDSKGKHFVLIRLLSRLFDVNNLNTKYYLHVASYKNDLNTSLEADPLPIKEYAVDVLPESLSEVDSFGQGGKVIYRVAALNLEELDPKLNYVFRLVQLAQESSEKVTKTKPELLKEILLASPLATYSLSSELVSKIYEDKTEIPHKTTIRRSRDHLLHTN